MKILAAIICILAIAGAWCCFAHAPGNAVGTAMIASMLNTIGGAVCLIIAIGSLVWLVAG